MSQEPDLIQLIYQNLKPKFNLELKTAGYIKLLEDWFEYEPIPQTLAIISIEINTIKIITGIITGNSTYTYDLSDPSFKIETIEEILNQVVNANRNKNKV